MIDQGLARLRLLNQLLARQVFDRPAEVVTWLGAVQAQDYQGALWALGLRVGGCRVEDVERDIEEARIVRTWPMRGTLHFVPAPDARWMLDLLAPRVIARSAGRFRQLGLDDEALAIGRRLLTGALAGGKQLTRGEAYEVLARGGVSPDGQRGIHVLSRLSQEGLLCFGPRRGRQPTFRLLEEWVPDARRMPRDEALATLGTRYFTSHGPATAEDFAWWAGVSIGDARRSVELAGSGLVRAAIGGKTYWLASSSPSESGTLDGDTTAHLLPAYDEYTVAYRDRSQVVDPAFGKLGIDLLIGSTIAIDGIVRGSWRRRLQRDRVVVATGLPSAPSQSEGRAVAAAAEAYGRFLGLPVTVETGVPAVSRHSGRVRMPDRVRMPEEAALDS